MQFLEVLWNYMLISAPYLLAGLALSGIIHTYIPISKVQKWLGGNKIGSVFRAAIIGIPLPLCSCSVIPTAVTLRKSGANNAATSSFLISTPESGVDSISLTYALMDLPMTILRPVAAFCSAIFAGILQLSFNKNFEINKDPKETEKKHDHEHSHSIDEGSRFVKAFKYGFGQLIDDISVWLCIGILAGALISFFIPADFFMNFTTTQNRFLILLIGIPLYICATASTPIAVSLMLKGISPGAALLLLLVGPATNIANIAVLQKYIGKKGVIINIISIAVVGLAFSFLADYLYSNYFDLKFLKGFESHDHASFAWWEQLSAVILSILILKGVYNEKFKKYFTKEKSSCCH